MPYNWPVKIAKYGITCPFQKFLVAKYESVIDWNGARITSAEALDAHIRDKMIPDLQRRLDPEDKKNHYCRAINLAAVLNNPAEHFNEVRGIHQRDGEEAARKFLLERINRDKKEEFDAWWNYLTQGNPVYADQPAFQYIILRPVIETSDAKCTRQPFPLDAEAVAFVHDGIEKESIDPSQNLIRKLAEFTAFGGRVPAFGTKCVWIMITKNMANAANRVAALSKGSGWCVASAGMAQGYLEYSDFHFLLKKGLAKVAVRTENGTASEIQGRDNSDPDTCWPQVLLYLNARAHLRTDYLTSYMFIDRLEAATSFIKKCKQELALIKTVRKLSTCLKKRPEKVQFIGDEILNDELFKPVIEKAWLACIKADPLAAGLAPGWMSREKTIDAALIRGWINILKVDFFAVRFLPESLSSRKQLTDEIRSAWGVVLHHDPSAFISCPDRFRKDPYILITRKSAIIRNLLNSHRVPVECPPDLINDPEIFRHLKSAWIRYFKSDQYNMTDCPAILLQFSDIRLVREKAWTQYATKNAKGFEVSCPDDLKCQPVILTARKQGWVNHISKEPSSFDDCPPDLKGQAEIQTARRMLFIKQLESILLANKTGIYDENDFPTDIRKDPDYHEIREMAWREVILARPPFFAAVPDDLLDKPGMRPGEASDSRANQALWLELIKQKPWLIEQADVVPRSIRHTKAMFDAYLEGWALKLRLMPWRLWHGSISGIDMSYAVLYHPKILEAMRDGWIDRNHSKKLKRAWDNAPSQTKNLLAVQLSILRALKMVHENGSYWPRGVLEQLADIYKANTCAETASDHEKVVREEILTLIKGIKGSPPRLIRSASKSYPEAGIAHSPQVITSAVVQSRERTKMKWISKIRLDPRHWQCCPVTLQTDADVLAELKNGWLKIVDSDPSTRGIPTHLAADPDIQQKIINAWRRNQDLLGTDCLSWPEFVCEDQVMSRRAITVFTRALRANPALWLTLPERWRQNPDLRNEAASCWAHSPTCEKKEPPADIRELVKELRSA